MEIKTLQPMGMKGFLIQIGKGNNGIGFIWNKTSKYKFAIKGKHSERGPCIAIAFWRIGFVIMWGDERSPAKVAD